MTPVLTADRVAAGYGGARIVDGVTFQVAAGDVLAILGPNGSGKSTLIKTLAGLVPLAEGTIHVEGRDVSGLSAHGRTRVGIAYVPQEHNVFRDMSVGENLALAHEFLPGVDGDMAVPLAMFPELRNRLTIRAGRLSGGERQMLAFACAMMARPKVLLLDEPSAGLSPRYVDEIIATTERVSRSGIGVVLVEQNAAAALRIAKGAIVLVGGRVRHSGSAVSVARDEDVRRLYLGSED